MSRRYALAVVAILAAAGCRSANPELYPVRPNQPCADLIVLDNHWHTAVIFRSTDIPEPFRAQLGPIAQSKYVMIGWGDEGFFRAEHVTVGLALQALFNSGGSVVLVVGLDDEPERSFDNQVDIYRIPTTVSSVERSIEAAILAFRREHDAVLDAGPGIDGGRFFAGSGHYAFYHTCNNWTADVLAAGGLPVSPAYAITAGNIAFQIRQLPGVRRNGIAVPRPPQPDPTALQLARGRRP